MVHFRRFRPDDIAAIVACAADVVGAVRLTRETFTENVLLDPNFQHEGLIVAENLEGEAIGAVYAVAPRNDYRGIAAQGGWITLLVVHPAHRRNGVGTALLARAEDHLKDSGATFANFSGYAPAYFTPGLDVTHNAEAVRLFSQHGYLPVEKPVSMSRPLRGFEISEEVSKKIAARRNESYEFGPARTEDLADVLAFASTTFDNDWADVLRDSVRRHGRPDRIQLARNPSGDVVGFATHCSYAGPEERFGPFGVDPTERGKAVGKILLNETLSAMSRQGLDEAWFLWTDLESPAGHLYASTGFAVSHQFVILQKSLAGEAPHQPEQGEQQ